MAWPISDPRIAAGAPGSHDLFFDLRNKLEEVVGNQSSLVNLGNVPPIPNGSFEIDPPGTVNPTGWTFTPKTGGSGVVTNSDSAHGAQCYSVNHPGGASNGGGTLAMDDMLAVGVGQAFEVFFQAKASSAGVHCKLYARWFDKDGIQIGTDVLVWDKSGTFPTSWRVFSVGVSPVLTPSEAKFMELYFVLGETDVDPGVSTDILLDGLAVTFRRLFTRYQWFTTSGVWTVPAGVSSAKVMLIGGGGGQAYLLPGGGGAYCEGYQDVYPGQAVTVTVGVGGTTGNGTPSTFLGLTAGGGAVGGAGGTASGGHLNLVGNLGTQPVSGQGGWCGAGYFAGFGRGKSTGNPVGNGFVIVFY